MAMGVNHLWDMQTTPAPFLKRGHALAQRLEREQPRTTKASDASPSFNRMSMRPDEMMQSDQTVFPEQPY
jgi:hypothetical protein